jgi:hypothetical protein
VVWCWTEGIVAIALLLAPDNSSALSAVRNVSIIIGLPFTGLLCMMVPCLWRCIKKEAGDEDIIKSYRFNTQLLDFLECFQPAGPRPCPPSKHIVCILTGLFVPGVNIFMINKKLYPDSMAYTLFVTIVGQVLYYAFLIFHIAESGTAGMHTIGWLCFLFFLCIVSFNRTEMRYKYNVWGSPVDDFTAAMFMYPFVLAQVQMMGDTDGKDAPLYFQSADEVIALMGAASTRTSNEEATGEIAAKPAAADVEAHA